MLRAKVLASLMAAGKVDCIFTTNFDPLAEDAALAANALLPTANQRRPTVAAIDLPTGRHVASTKPIGR